GPARGAGPDRVGGQAALLGARDLVGVARLHHAILVDARGMCEGVGADHRLVRLHHAAGDLRHQARGWDDVRGVDPSLEMEEIAPRLDGHDHFLQRGVAGALAEAVDGAFNLPRAAKLYRGERVRYRHAEVVMAVHRPHRLVRVGHALPYFLDELAELLRYRIPDRVGDVDGGRALLDHRLEHAAEKVEVGTAAILGRELDVGAGVLGESNREARLFQHLLGSHAQLFLHVQRAGGDEH